MHEITEKFLIEEIRKANKGDKVKIEWKDLYHQTGIDTGVHSGEYELLDVEWAMIGKPHDIKIHDVTAGKMYTLSLAMITRFEVIGYKLFPEPMNLVKVIGESGGSRKFNKDAFYSYTGDSRYFFILVNGKCYECLYKKTNTESNGCIEIQCGQLHGSDEFAARLWEDELVVVDEKSQAVREYPIDKFTLETTDHKNIPMDEIFKSEKIFIWDNIDEKLEIGESYSLKLPDYDTLVDGIFLGLYSDLIFGHVIRFTFYDEECETEHHMKIIDITASAIGTGECEVRELALKGGRT